MFSFDWVILGTSLSPPSIRVGYQEVLPRGEFIVPRKRLSLVVYLVFHAELQLWAWDYRLSSNLTAWWNVESLGWADR